MLVFDFGRLWVFRDMLLITSHNPVKVTLMLENSYLFAVVSNYRVDQCCV